MIISYIMPLSWNEIRSRALEFSKEWETETRENAEAKSFWDGFFKVFGIQRRKIGIFEKHVKKLGNKEGFIDLFWPGTLLVEHKSRGKNLDKAFEQASDYFEGLEDYELPRYVLISDFAKFRIYDLEEDTEREFKLKNLVDNVQLFDFIAGYEKRTYKESDPVNIEAAELMGKLHDRLKENGYEGHNLEVYLVRLLFCLFADDTGIFEKDIFLDFIQNRTSSDGSDLAAKLTELFQVLNTPEDKRPKTLDESLSIFPYINGKLFEEQLLVASFDREMRRILFESCYLDWGKVSPAIFGSLFQSVMDSELRRNLGAHYTSEKNILKLINPLFMDELWAEFDRVKNNIRKLKEFHDEIADLKLLDPACGCGNFLIIAYRELRLLETEIIKILYSHSDGDIQQSFHIQELSKIDVDSFYGIEIEEFPARIAEVSMWMMDHLMNRELSIAIGHYYTRLPLKNAANIHLENALKTDWEYIVSQNELSYIIGNPPFAGKHLQDLNQKEDMDIVFEGVNGYKVLDYVAAWYLKAAEYIQYSDIKVAFVSTNSITQGEQVGILWNELFNNYGVKIHFAHRTFKWTNEARGNAGVYVVIIGFASFDIKQKLIYEYEKPTSDPHAIKVKNINPYLVESDDLVILKRRNPISDVPKIMFGSKLVDGGNFTLNDEEKISLIQKEPDAEYYIKPLLGAKSYLNNKNRWVLWLKDIPPKKLRKMPEVYNRVSEVRNFRMESKKAKTVESADTPTEFSELRQPDTDFIIVPRTTSENRKYIPLAFYSKDYIIDSSITVIPDANLYHFGVLSAIMHMTWMRYVAGRLENRYRYSNQIVYNNFPWPTNLSKQSIENVEQNAKNLLDIRSEFKESSLADLYDPLAMPPKLVKAHQNLDNSVDKCYGAKFNNDSERIKFLFELYENYVGL